ncbi:hypothetical protein G9A89_016455 [Geosiphon pyriformis]|nr:hypothetical protein G9A89_016455 [Geosiphon pyriformis]
MNHLRRFKRLKIPFAYLKSKIFRIKKNGERNPIIITTSNSNSNFFPSSSSSSRIEKKLNLLSSFFACPKNESKDLNVIVDFLKKYISTENISENEFFQIVDNLQHLPKYSFILGILHKVGFGTKVSEQKAFYWFRFALENHVYDPLAYEQLAICYDNGIGIDQDSEKAHEIYERMALKGNAAAQCKLAEMYLNGTGTIMNHKLAHYWFEKSASQNFSRAQRLLGDWYQKGYTGIKDDKESFKWYKLAAENDEPEAQAQYGEFFFWGRYVTRNEQEALKWYEKSAENGNPLAMARLSKCYKEGIFVPLNIQLAFDYCTRSANAGNRIGMNLLSHFYYKGIGTRKDLNKAYYWTWCSALIKDDNLPVLFTNVAACFVNGFGMPRDIHMALRWFRKAMTIGEDDKHSDKKLRVLFKVSE